MSTEKQKIDKGVVTSIYLDLCENNFKAFMHIIHSYIHTFSVHLHSSHKEIRLKQNRTFSEREEILTKFFKRCFIVKLTGK